MMEEQNKISENVIYVYDGFISDTSTVRYDDIPVYNGTYPYSVATSSIPVEEGDDITVGYTGTAINKRLRAYDLSGNASGTIKYDFTFDSIPQNTGWVRFLATQGTFSFDYIKVTKPDGTEINYTIIDMRGD